MSISDWKNPLHSIDDFRADFAGKSDEYLITIAETWKGQKPGIAAAIILADQKAKLAEKNHAKLLAEIKRPHWSVTPSFIVGIIGSISAVAAAYYAYLAYSQPQQLTSVNQQSQNASPMLQKHLPSLPLQPPQSRKGSN